MDTIGVHSVGLTLEVEKVYIKAWSKSGWIELSWTLTYS